MPSSNTEFGQIRVHVLYKRAEIPAKTVIPAIALSSILVGHFRLAPERLAMAVTEALDHLRVMLKSSLRIRVPEVALNVLDSSMALYVRRRRAAECLECEIVNPGFLC